MKGIAYLAQKSDAIIIPAFCWPKSEFSNTSILKFSQPVDPRYYSDLPPEEFTYNILADTLGAFETQLNSYPTHWRYWESYNQKTVPHALPAKLKSEVFVTLPHLKNIFCHDMNMDERVDIESNLDSLLQSH